MTKLDFKPYLPVIFAISLAGLLAWVLWLGKNNRELQKTAEIPQKSVSRDIIPAPAKEEKLDIKTKLSEPLDKALERITKKPFGLKVSPQDSPVSPERFSGYHTGVDFETFFEEQNVEVSVYAICEGPLVQKRFVSGYGGVAVQRCVLEGRDIIVVYGHLQLSSIGYNTGQQILAGSRLGILGKGFSAETDGERKHLHLGIHLGSEINLAGYVKKESDLDNWLDITKYIK